MLLYQIRIAIYLMILILFRLKMEFFRMKQLDNFLTKQKSLKYLKYDALNTLALQRKWSDIE